MRLLFGCETTQICFQTLVDSFVLTISLGMTGNVEMQLGALKLEQFLPEIACESWIMVKDKRLGHSMEFEDIVHENLSHRGSYKWVLEGTKMSIYEKAINHYHDD
jgi:hypothetical protein